MPSQKGCDMDDYPKKKFKGKKHIGHYRADDSSDSEDEKGDQSLFILRAKKVVSSSRNAVHQDVAEVTESESSELEESSGNSFP